jgi:hypothetical protein
MGASIAARGALAASGAEVAVLHHLHAGAPASATAAV